MPILSHDEIDDAVQAAVQVRAWEHQRTLTLRLGPKVASHMPKDAAMGLTWLENSLRVLDGMGLVGEVPPVLTWLRWAQDVAPRGSTQARRFRKLQDAHFADARRDRGRRVRRGRDEVHALLVRVEGAQRIYESGDEVLAEVAGPSGAMPDGEGAFDWLFPSTIRPKLFQALWGNDRAAHGRAACRVQFAEPPAALGGLWQLEEGYNPLLVETQLPWTLSLAPSAEQPVSVRLEPLVAPPILVIGPASLEEAEYGSFRQTLMSRRIDYGRTDRLAFESDPVRVATRMRDQRPRFVVLIHPTRPQVRQTMRALDQRFSTVLWMSAPDEAEPAAREAGACVALVHGVAPLNESFAPVADLLRVVVLEGVDPVSAVFRRYRATDAGRRVAFARRWTVWSRYDHWEAEPLAAKKRPHPHIALDRVHQRLELRKQLSKQLRRGSCGLVTLVSGRREDYVQLVGALLFRDLRAEGMVEPKYVELGLYRSGVRVADVGQRLVTALAGTWSSDDPVGCLLDALRAQMPRSAGDGYLWLDLGVWPTAPEWEPVVAEIIRLLQQAALNSTRGPLRFGAVIAFEGGASDDERRGALVKAHSLKGAQGRRFLVADLGTIGSEVSEDELEDYFGDPIYSPDTIDRPEDLAEAVSAHTDGVYTECLQCIAVGISYGWDELLRRLRDAPADPFAGLDCTLIEEDFEV